MELPGNLGPCLPRRPINWPGAEPVGMNVLLSAYMPTFWELVKRLEALQAQGLWPEMLLEISNVVIAMLQDPRAKGLVYGSAELDQFCLNAGAMSSAQLGLAAPAQYQGDVAVHLATELYHGQGGHSLALKDVIRARPDLKHLVLVTNLHERQLPLQAFARDLPASVQVVLAPSVALPDKLRWLQLQLAAIKPGLLTLFNHHYDVVTVAAAQAGAAREVAYYHHADHDMALGVFLPHALHVDCTNVSFHKCQNYLGVHNAVYWPLVAPDLGVRPQHVFMAHGVLTTCSHGSPNKFLSPGRYAYFDVMLRRLTEVNGAHVHIGSLPEDVVAAFRARLAEAGVDPTRFVHQPPVPNLWAFLRDSSIDLCISSFPMQGAKGLVETQGAGLPLLMQQSGLSKHHSTRDLIYESALWWQRPDDLIRVLSSLTPALLAEQAAAARHFYDCWHHPRELAYAMSNPRRTAECPPVQFPSVDTLALYLR